MTVETNITDLTPIKGLTNENEASSLAKVKAFRWCIKVKAEITPPT